MKCAFFGLIIKKRLIFSFWLVDLIDKKVNLILDGKIILFFALSLKKNDKIQNLKIMNFMKQIKINGLHFEMIWL